MGIFDFLTPKQKKNPVENLDKRKPRSSSISDKIVKLSLIRSRVDIEEWRLGLSAAERRHNPNRSRIAKVYKEIKLVSE